MSTDVRPAFCETCKTAFVILLSSVLPPMSGCRIVTWSGYHGNGMLGGELMSHENIDKNIDYNKE